MLNGGSHLCDEPSQLLAEVIGVATAGRNAFSERRLCMAGPVQAPQRCCLAAVSTPQRKDWTHWRGCSARGGCKAQT